MEEPASLMSALGAVGSQSSTPCLPYFFAWIYLTCNQSGSGCLLKNIFLCACLTKGVQQRNEQKLFSSW